MVKRHIGIIDYEFRTQDLRIPHPRTMYATGAKVAFGELYKSPTVTP